MIGFLSASNGMIELKSTRQGATRDVLLVSNIPAEIAAALEKFGTDEYILNSSSMDFASESGFPTNNSAWDIWNAALEIAGLETEY